MKNKKLKIATSVISLGILITPISTLINNSNIANAQNYNYNKKTNLSKEHKNYILNKAKEFELSEAQVNNIITKIENGIILDCMISSKKPIKIKKISNTEYIYYYEDGSAKKQTILKDEKTKEKTTNKSLISPRSIYGGNIYWGSNYKYTSNALIKNDTFYGNFTFRANYINMGRYGGQITNVYDARYWGIGTYSNISLWIQEQTGNPARAVMTVNWSAPGGIASSLLKLELFVDSYNAWTGQ